MKPGLHFWTVKTWMNEPGQNHNAFSIWASPSFVLAAQKAMAAMDEGQAQKGAWDIIKRSSLSSIYSEHHQWLKFRPEVGLAHIDCPGNACGLDLDFKSADQYLRTGFTLLPHNIDTANQQSVLFAIWLWWAQYVELFVDIPIPLEGAGS